MVSPADREFRNETVIHTKKTRRKTKSFSPGKGNTEEVSGIYHDSAVNKNHMVII